MILSVDSNFPEDASTQKGHIFPKLYIKMENFGLRREEPYPNYYFVDPSLGTIATVIIYQK